jgi:hypothetical protein
MAGLEEPNMGSTAMWETLLADPAKFSEAFGKANVPKDIIDQLAAAFTTTADPTVTAAQESAMQPSFTTDEFLLCLKRKKGNSAGGRSGMTYGLLKILPVHIQAHPFKMMNTL